MTLRILLAINVTFSRQCSNVLFGITDLDYHRKGSRTFYIFLFWSSYGDSCVASFMNIHKNRGIHQNTTTVGIWIINFYLSGIQMTSLEFRPPLYAIFLYGLSKNRGSKIGWIWANFMLHLIFNLFFKCWMFSFNNDSWLS